MKLQAGARREIEKILRDVERAENYLLREDVAGIAHRAKSPNGASYKIINPACLADMSGGSAPEAVDVVNKHVGSNITGLYDARLRLRWLLDVAG